MRYTYNVSVADANFECADVQEVVKAVNEHTGFPMLTEAMVFSLLTRPQRANKRLFAAGKIQIGRTRLPTKAEREAEAMMQMDQPQMSKSDL